MPKGFVSFPWKIYYGTRSAYKERAAHRVVIDDQTGRSKGRKCFACYYPPHSNPESRKTQRRPSEKHAARHVANQFACVCVQLKRAAAMHRCHSSLSCTLCLMGRGKWSTWSPLLRQLRKATHSTSWNDWKKDTVAMVTDMWMFFFFFFQKELKRFKLGGEKS